MPAENSPLCKYLMWRLTLTSIA